MKYYIQMETRKLKDKMFKDNVLSSTYAQTFFSFTKTYHKASLTKFWHTLNILNAIL